MTFISDKLGFIVIGCEKQTGSDMQNFKNILLVMNPEADDAMSLEKAVHLIRKSGGKLTLISVLYEPSGLSSSDSDVQAQRTSAMAKRKKWLQGLLINHADLEVTIEVVEGAHFIEIIRQVLRETHDLVIITAEDKKGIRKRLFGTTTMHLMRKCPCPVWVVKGAQVRAYEHILAAVDPTGLDLERNSLNPIILQLAAGLTRTEAATLHIVHVTPLLNRRYVRRMSIQDVEELIKLEKTEYQQRIEDLLNQADVADLTPHMHLLEGDPGERIPELVVKQNIDLLVMGSVCRTGISGFLIGNTAEEVLNQVDCSVLTLKPEGFVTPVTLV